MEPRLKWNKIVLAAKTILFHFRRDVWSETKIILAAKTIFISFQTWFHVKIKQ